MQQYNQKVAAALICTQHKCSFTSPSGLLILFHCRAPRLSGISTGTRRIRRQYHIVLSCLFRDPSTSVSTLTSMCDGGQSDSNLNYTINSERTATQIRKTAGKVEVVCNLHCRAHVTQLLMHTNCIWPPSPLPPPQPSKHRIQCRLITPDAHVICK